MDDSRLNETMGEERSSFRRWIEQIPLGIFPLLLGGIIFLRLPLGASLWLDESMTWWAIKDSFGVLVGRSLAHQGQPLPYCALLWSLVQAFPASELLLRLPSVVSLVGSGWLLFLLVEKLADRETAIITLLFYLPLDPVLVAGVSARPYGVALVSSFASYYWAVRWCESRRIFWGILSALAAALAFHCHLFFGGAAAVTAVLVFWRGGEIAVRHKVWVASLYLVFIAPAVVPILYWPDMGAVFGNDGVPSIASLMNGYFPLKSVVVFGCALAGAMIVAPIRLRMEVLCSPLFLLSLLLFIVRPLVFYSYAHLAGSGYYERWFLWGVPGLCLVYALILRAIRDPWPRRVSVCVVAILCFGMESERVWNPEEWREGVGALNEELVHDKAPVFLYSSLSETGISEWFFDPTKAEFLRAPLSFYRVESEVTPVPLVPLTAGMREVLGGMMGSFGAPSEMYFIMLDHVRPAPHGDTKRLASMEYEEFFRGHHYTMSPIFPGKIVKVFKLHKVSETSQNGAKKSAF